MSVLKKFNFYSKIFFLVGATLLVPLLVLPFFPSEIIYAPAFVIPAVFCAAFGMFVHFTGVIRASLNLRPTSNRQGGIVAVVSIWLFLFFIGSLPFFIGGQAGFLSSLYESVAGWTTAGFTVFSFPETLPKIFLLFRCLMQFCGGLGIVLLVIVFGGGAEATKLFSAEGHEDKLEPSLKNTARTMLLIYAIIHVFGIVLYTIFGMSVFDAICYTMSAVSTGGFANHAGSVGYFNSIPIEVVTIVLMFLGGTNFAFFALLAKRKIAHALKVGEIRFYLIYLTLAVLALCVLGFSFYPSLGESFHHALFTAVSVSTTTGFSVGSISQWPSASFVILLILMTVGGGLGSTSCGFKYSRLYILYKSFVYRLKGKFKPERSIAQMTIHRVSGKSTVTEGQLLDIHHFVIMYVATALVGALVFSFDGCSFQTAVLEASSALSAIGVNFGINPVAAGPKIMITQMVLMFLGRLEVYIVYIAIFAIFRRGLRFFKR